MDLEKLISEEEIGEIRDQIWSKIHESHKSSDS